MSSVARQSHWHSIPKIYKTRTPRLGLTVDRTEGTPSVLVYLPPTLKGLIADILRYSERKEQEHWFSGGKDGNSYAGAHPFIATL